MFVDVHTHLTHPDFAGDLPAVIARARAAGVTAMVVNGTDPDTNRAVMALSRQYPEVKPALGIYPVDAVNSLLPADFKLTVARFDVTAEIEVIRSLAAAGALAAIGECGLDGYWLTEDTHPLQERVFRELISVAMAADIPVIVHTRKLEARAADILREMGARKVDFHCFGGRVSLARQCAEKDGWWFSIPANARVNEAFRKMLATLPPERLLTETDAPWLAPTRGERNEPANVVGTVALLAELRSWTPEAARARVLANYTELFGPRWL